MPTRRSTLAGGIGLAVSISLLSQPSPAEAQDKVPVVATFSILGDFVRNVGGERIELATLVGPNGDGHVYSPAPADARKLSQARLVFVNGLKFEGWINRLVRSSGTKARVVETAKGVQTIKAADEATGQDHGDHGHAGEVDPHAWQSVPNAKIYVGAIRDALVAADPAGRSVYEANAAAYLGKLDEVDREVRDAVAGVPAERRRVITSHDAFGYFEKTYGIDFISPQGVSTDAEASARDVARIIAQVRKAKAPAVFLENVSDPRLAKRISDETGAKIGGTLYSDALSEPSEPASTYLDMMRHNARTLAAALAPTS